MAKDDFLTAFLQGLYQSGVGNPEVNDRRQQSQLENQYKQAQINQNAAANGLVPATPQPGQPGGQPAQGSFGADHPIMSKVLGTMRSMFYPTSGNVQPLQTAFKPDPNQGIYSQDSTGRVSLSPGGTPLPAGSSKLDRDKGASLLNSQRPKPNNLSTVSWETSSPQQQLLADRLIRGEIQTSDLGFRERSQVVSLASERAQQQGVPFKSYGGHVQSKMDVYMTSGKGGQNALSLRTALAHLDGAYDAFQAIDNTDFNLLNTPINKLKEKTDDPKVIGLDLNLTALRSEMATAFKGSGATDQEISAFNEALNSSLTPQQAFGPGGAIDKADQLLRSRMTELQDQKDNSISRNRKGASLMDEHSKAVRGKMDARNQPAKEFKNLLQAQAANLPKGTRIKIGGRMATVQ